MSVRKKWRHSWDILFALMLREMATRFGRSWGGYLWAVIEPVGMIAMLALIFSYYFGTPPIGDSFALFYATGLIPFLAFTEIMHQTGATLIQNKNLLYFKYVTPLDTLLARFVLGCVTLVVVGGIAFSGTLAFADEGFDINLPVLMAAMAAAVLLGLGVGSVNAVCFVFFPTWKNIWSVLHRPLFLISGIFFLFDSLPYQTQDFLWWNPLVHVIGHARKAFYPTYDGTFVSIGYALAFGIAAFVIGAAILIGKRGRIVEVV